MHTLHTLQDDLGLPLTGEVWGERLLIPKKGGGHHFDESELSAASSAFSRAGALLTAVTWHEQLCSRASQCTASVSLFRGGSKRHSGGGLSKAQMISRCSDLLSGLLKTRREIFEDGGFAAATAQMAALRVSRRAPRASLTLSTSP